MVVEGHRGNRQRACIARSTNSTTVRASSSPWSCSPRDRVTDAEHGVDFAAQAFDQLEREHYGTTHGRIPAVRCAPEGTLQAQVLHERVRSLPAVG